MFDAIKRRQNWSLAIVWPQRCETNWHLKTELLDNNCSSNSKDRYESIYKVSSTAGHSIMTCSQKNAMFGHFPKWPDTDVMRTGITSSNHIQPMWKLVGWQYFQCSTRWYRYYLYTWESKWDTVSTTSCLLLKSWDTRVVYAVRRSSILTWELQARGSTIVRLRRAINIISSSRVSNINFV